MDMMNTQELIATHGPREAMDYDVVVVGAGRPGCHRDPVEAACAGRERRRAREGLGARRAHPLGRRDGPARDGRAVPGLEEAGAPLDQAVTGDDVLFLSETGSTRTPTGWCRATCTTTATTSSACRTSSSGWRSRPKRSASKSSRALPRPRCCTTSRDASRAWRPATWASRRKASLARTSSSAWNCAASTVFAEGARGHLGKQLLARYKLTEGRDTQTYAIGIKELWEMPADKAQPGRVVHTAGWPMAGDTFGGGFLYHLADNQVTLGFVVGLDYART
jgi:electron-transferring-flavoprotein dehydrogenase